MANKDYKIESINIMKFRKLQDVDFNIADRLTIISGHNGIGKSTILGLIANGSEFTQIPSLFEKTFRSKFEEIFHLDEEKDYHTDQDKKYKVILKYKYAGQDLYKSCSISRHREKKKSLWRLKIVPRTCDSKGATRKEKIADIGPDAKVKIPTLYVGLSRIIPIGESDPKFYETTNTKKVNESDQKYIKRYYSEVLNTEEFIDGVMIKQHLKHSEKKSLGPTFADYPFKSISVGQDSLTTILTALASFNMLERELKDNYKGGILLIDEIDCGLHPYAQKKLIQILKIESKRLNLQIIATTHSLTILQDVLNLKSASENPRSQEKNLYNVIYLSGSKKPQIYKNPTYKQIKNDLFILPQTNLKDDKITIIIYLEDKEAKTLFEYILHNNEEKFSKIRLVIIDSQIPCDTLIKLPEKDKYFQKVIVVLDGDVRAQGKYSSYFENYSNLLCLPGNFSPEQTFCNFIKSLLENMDHQFWVDKFALISEPRMNVIIQEIESSLKDKASNGRNREKYKKWFNKYIGEFEAAELHKYWIAENSKEINQFLDELNKSILHVTPSLNSTLL